MTEAARISDEELHAYIDDELPPGRMAEVGRMLEQDAALAARVAAYRRDKLQMAAIFGPVAGRPLPAAWLRRIEAAPAPARRRDRPGWRMAAAAAVLLALIGGGLAVLRQPGDTILEEAAAARAGGMPAEQVLSGSGLPAAAARNLLLQAMLHLPVRVPDLERFGYRLDGLDIFRRGGSAAVELVYRNASAAPLTIYVRRSSGEARFDLLRRGTLRVCVWQDDVVGAVMTGDMPAGVMMRVASKAYSDLDL